MGVWKEEGCLGREAGPVEVGLEVGGVVLGL